MGRWVGRPEGASSVRVACGSSAFGRRGGGRFQVASLADGAGPKGEKGAEQRGGGSGHLLCPQRLGMGHVVAAYGG